MKTILDCLITNFSIESYSDFKCDFKCWFMFEMKCKDTIKVNILVTAMSMRKVFFHGNNKKIIFFCFFRFQFTFHHKVFLFHGNEDDGEIESDLWLFQVILEAFSSQYSFLSLIIFFSILLYSHSLFYQT